MGRYNFDKIVDRKHTKSPNMILLLIQRGSKPADVFAVLGGRHGF